MNESQPELEVDSISLTLSGKNLFSDLSLSINKGEVFSLIGPNGSGKTSLLRCLSGYYRINAGTVRVRGHPIEKMPQSERAKTIALVPQRPVVPAGVTVWQALLTGRHPHIGFYGSESESDIQACLRISELISMQSMLERNVESLSGGELQRVLIGRALCQQTPILILDEPTSQLDIGYKTEVLEIVRLSSRELGITVVMALHDLTIAGHYSDRLALLMSGNIETLGTPEIVLDNALLSRVFGTDLIGIAHPVSASPMVLPGFRNTGNHLAGDEPS